MATQNLPRREDDPSKPKRGRGRPKGVPNRVGQTIKEALLQSFDEIGGVLWLKKLAKEEPKAYASLMAKLIPAATVNVDADGKPAPLEISISYKKPTVADSDPEPTEE